MSTLADEHGWLEDNVIHFWIQYLENEEMYNFPKARIELFAPSMATLLKLNNTAVSRTILGQMPDLAENKTTHIFIPVNSDRVSDHEYGNNKSDSDQNTAGTHWSLLVISLIDNVGFHYDSLDGLNSGDARDLLKGIEAALPVPRTLRFVDMKDSPQQTDGSNCGIFALVIMKHLLLKRLLRADANQKITMSMKDQDIDYDGARKMIRSLIEERREEAIRRKSFNSEDVPAMPCKIADTKTATKRSSP
ncbi:cysteine proteinase [Karstenula rhodostoma CBS 690.94]|uniref:Cysteine proteinase n=1 Tax=Karstenula rhodostoma CBS 690.94 TaxID=1392251 RepID=A0A9P4PE15_9PLEO|nr:cysteine proteinase [Karstenula rhodostoma CBS 690.94]